MQLPSIFNDVIGPIMRGPSSSHTAASWRVAKIATQLLQDELAKASIEMDKDGAWTTNYREQGTALGMDGGLLDIDMADNAMKLTDEIAKERGIEISYLTTTSFENFHPNSVLCKLSSRSGEEVKVLAASLGGGSFEVQKINDFRINIKGDYHELLIFTSQNIEDLLKEKINQYSTFQMSQKGEDYLYLFSNASEYNTELVKEIRRIKDVVQVKTLVPIMPIISGREEEMPFDSISSLVEYSKKTNLSLAQLGLLYEQKRSGLSEIALREKMTGIINIIENSIVNGLRGTTYDDRILPQQSNLVGKAEKAGKILQNSIVNTIIENVAAIMESKSALEVIVANPTAGSCGTVGAALSAVADEVDASFDDKIDAYFAAGLVGAYFAMGPGFSAEEHGCQVECGASAGMAAAGIVNYFGGSAEQALGAASMAIQNMIGLICDPIADRVEAPCLGKNTSAAVNALSSATMAVSGFNHLIPLDQVLETVQRVSDQMPSCNKCTGLGGLAITPAALALKEKLNKS